MTSFLISVAWAVAAYAASALLSTRVCAWYVRKTKEFVKAGLLAEEIEAVAAKRGPELFAILPVLFAVVVFIIALSVSF